MPRIRSRWRRNSKVVSTWIANKSPFLWTQVHHVDTEFESMTDGSVGLPHQKRIFKLMDAARGTRKLKTRGGKYPFRPMTYTSTQKREQVGACIRHDAYTSSTNGRDWKATGCITQSDIVSFYGSMSSIPSWPSVSDPLTAADIEAVTKSLSHLDRPKLSLGEPIAELRTLPRDLRGSLEPIKDIMTTFQKKALSKFSKAKKITYQMLGPLWAEHAFFAAPLLRTANDVCEEYASRLNVYNDLLQVARGRSRVRSNTVRKSTNGSAGFAWTFLQERYKVAEVHYGIVYHSAGRNSTIPGNLGLLPRDWPSTAWELVPLSFFVDRVFNVRRFIKTTMALSSPDVEISPDSFKVIKTEDVRRCRFTSIRSITNPQWNYESPPNTPWYEEKDFSYSRSRWIPGINDVRHTLRGSGLVNSLSKTLDVTSVILMRSSFK
jgi:hypothetical protein